MAYIQREGQQSSENRGSDGNDQSGPSRRSFLKTTAAALGGVAFGNSGSGGSAPVDRFSEVYASAHLRLQAAKEGAARGVQQIAEASARMAAGESSVAIEAGGMDAAARILHHQTLEAEAAKRDILDAYMKEHGVTLQPLNTAADPGIIKAKNTVAEAKKILRDDARALADLKKQVQRDDQRQAHREEAYEKQCADLRTLLVEPDYIRVIEGTLGSTPRYIVTIINHSKDTGTENHRGRKATLQRLYAKVAEQRISELEAPPLQSERWIIRKPKGPLRAVLAEAASLGK